MANKSITAPKNIYFSLDQHNPLYNPEFAQFVLEQYTQHLEPYGFIPTHACSILNDESITHVIHYTNKGITVPHFNFMEITNVNDDGFNSYGYIYHNELILTIISQI